MKGLLHPIIIRDARMRAAAATNIRVNRPKLEQERHKADAMDVKPNQEQIRPPCHCLFSGLPEHENQKKCDTHKHGADDRQEPPLGC